jgi:type II secretory pathway component PulF
LLTQLNSAVAGGLTVGEAFAAQRPAVSELEAGIVSAVERAGRLDRGLAQLAEYFGALDAARAGVIRKIAYPVFVLHFGILVLGVPTLMASGLRAYVRETGFILALFYGVAIVIGLAVPLLRDLGSISARVDALLRMIPLIGGIRRDFAVARFCATYEMQLGASVNVMDGLAAAARASRSAMIAAAVKRALPEVRGGAQVGPLLALSQAFPQPMIQSFSVGEETGRLGEELDRLATDHQAAAITKLDTLAEWLPKLIYLAVCLYLGYRIVTWYGGYLQQVEDLTKQM